MSQNYETSLQAHPAGLWHSLSQEMQPSPHGQPLVQCLQQPPLDSDAGVTSGFALLFFGLDLGVDVGLGPGAEAAHGQVEQFSSHLFFASSSSTVCHCMFEGASAPQQASGQMWSTR